jgi:hypothetical protein
MKLIPYVLASMVLALSAQAASIEGEITLAYSLSNTSGIALLKEFGDVVKATCGCRVGEFFGWESVISQITVTNTGSKPMWGQCCVAFYDKDRKLVGAAAQGFTTRRGLKPRTARALGPCRIILPKDKYKDIVSYQAVINEMDTPPLKTKDSILLENP